jgi:MFS family permease
MLGRLPYKYAVAVVTVLALFMDLLDLTIVNVAVPKLGEEFGAQPAQLQWAVTAYLLSLAVFLPASGWLSDRFGSKRTFVFALLIFTIASALCAAAWSLESLVAFRALQGVGGGLLVPVGMAVLFGAFPEEERSTASVIFSVPGAVAPALGPVLGGYLVTSFDWR